jgi:hypothetical protein
MADTYAGVIPTRDEVIGHTKFPRNGQACLLHTGPTRRAGRMRLLAQEDEKGDINMAGLGEIAISTAPLLGGALLAGAAGQLKGPDYRSGIDQDLDLLERLPADQVDRRAAILRTIELRIDDMVSATHKSRQLRAAAASYQGNWRDIVLLVCAVLFTYVWWHVSHHRTDWLPMFVVLIAACLLTAVYAFRGSVRSVRRLIRSTPTVGG